MIEPVLSLEGVAVEYRRPFVFNLSSRKEKSYALKDVDLCFRTGERVGLVGANGAGKSTLLKLMSGVLTPSAGTIQVRKKVASVLDIAGGMNAGLTGRENARLKYYLSKTTIRWREFEQHVETVSGLGSMLDQPVSSYSSGMKARLDRSMLKLTQGDIYLFDEWVAVLDADYERQSSRGIQANAALIVVASHSERVLRTWCDEIVWLQGGRVYARGGIDEVLPDYQRAVKTKTS